MHRTVPRFSEPQSKSDSVLSCVIAYNEFGAYCIPRSSLQRPVAQEIMFGRMWEEKTVEFLRSNCRDGDIVHAGTYYGDFLPALSDACSPGAMIWAFEPNLENYRCASITIQINDLQNIRLTNAGLAASQGSARIITKDTSGKGLGGLSKIVEENEDSALAALTQMKKIHNIALSKADLGASQGSATIVKEDTSENGLGGLSNNNDSALATITEKISLVAIDDFIPEERRISIIQLDVEGHEQQALTGALKTIQRCRPILVVESMPEDSWLSENIFQLGYEHEKTIEHNRILIPKSQ